MVSREKLATHSTLCNIVVFWAKKFKYLVDVRQIR